MLVAECGRVVPCCSPDSTMHGDRLNFILNTYQLGTEFFHQNSVSPFYRAVPDPLVSSFVLSLEKGFTV